MIGKLAVLFSILVAATATIDGQNTAEIQLTSDPNRAAVADKLVEGRVTAVRDGDTISLRARGGTVYVIRLQGIDAPDENQQWFGESRKSLSDLLLNKQVKALLYKTDGDGRSIASVYFKGRDVGLVQVEAGMAWHYGKFSYEQSAASRKLYAQAEAKARAERLGLWKDENPTAPWIFRGEDKPVEAPPAASTISAASSSNGERRYILGPRGGCYYVSGSGRKVYVQDKSLCGTPSSTKP